MHYQHECDVPCLLFFFFQAEDGIRDLTVTGVQTCALPIASAAVASLSSSTVRSIIDTFGVGTRMAIPSNLPLSWGSTRCRALAAPVLVGTIETAAARARRKSLWGRSRSCWSFV